MARGKFPNNEWRFDYHPGRRLWETYRMPADWPAGLYKWLFDNFGLNRGMDSNSDWDYIGGWIYFYNEKCITAFMLRWA